MSNSRAKWLMLMAKNIYTIYCLGVTLYSLNLKTVNVLKLT